ncbi:Acetyl esterase/lipase [Nakamurella panacisegetis]|uniref:Acetyl esterase/lipase n=1 Tax=Nakamurella panacisegetis TaxID=1090615 RepID=A0A1H0LGN7_9ACTN|nr:alpha/beta hydrolase [Nakamurella panacisegetis]SDO67181.1 Acetyl esterase/lipase [Nakamurella panacisegetis]
MTSRHLVDPQLTDVLDAWPPLALTNESLPSIREQNRLEMISTRPVDPPFPDVTLAEHFIDGPAGAGALRILVISPRLQATAAPGLLWVHGGGYVMGSADQDSLQVQRLVSAVGCVAAVVDYRLAPETPHPGPIEDCLAALRWLHDAASTIGVDASRIGVAGESAGGGLAAALCLLNRDLQAVPVILQLLIYPMLDDRTVTHPDPHPYTGEFVWNADSNRFGWAALLGEEPGGQDISPYAAPARATDLSGLPPTYLDVGTLDLFFEEDVDYARRLVRAGVPTELHVYPGAFHGYPRAETSAAAIAHQAAVEAALRRGLSVG